MSMKLLRTENGLKLWVEEGRYYVTLVKDKNTSASLEAAHYEAELTCWRGDVVRLTTSRQQTVSDWYDAVYAGEL